jgi:hypothetical protein
MGTHTMCMFSPVTILTKQLEMVFRETISTEPSVEMSTSLTTNATSMICPIIVNMIYRWR